jgi:hypothetical protein
MVGIVALNHAILVRIQVPQQQVKYSIMDD